MRTVPPSTCTHERISSHGAVNGTEGPPDARGTQLSEWLPGGGDEEPSHQRMRDLCACTPIVQRLPVRQRDDADLRCRKVVGGHVHGRAETVRELRAEGDRRWKALGERPGQRPRSDRGHLSKVRKLRHFCRKNRATMPLTSRDRRHRGYRPASSSSYRAPKRAATASHECERRTCRYAASPRLAAGLLVVHGLDQRLHQAVPVIGVHQPAVRASPGSVFTNDVGPPLRVAITGTPHAIASTSIWPKPSRAEGATITSAQARPSGSSV